MSPFIVGIHKQWTGYDMIGRRTVTAKHDILHAGQAGQGFNICIVRLQCHWIGKEKQIVNFPIHNA